MLLVTAAGNTGENDDDPAHARYPCGYDRPTELCVTASDQHDGLPSWANYGAHTVDLAAPGDNVYSTLRNNRYGFVSGGSMAAAQVSGAAGLILSSESLSTTALKADILQSVDPLASLAGKVRSGGRLDVCDAIPACAPPVNTQPASVSGRSVEGEALTASPGSWTNTTGPYEYEWERCDQSGGHCAPIPGATDSGYVLGSADLGATVRVLVTTAHPGGSSSSMSAATAVVTEPAPQAPPDAPPESGAQASTSPGGAISSSPPAATPPPALVTSFTVAPRSLIVRAGKRSRTSETTFTLTATRPHAVSLVIQKEVLGRVSGGRCRSRSPHGEKSARCLLFVTVRTLHFNAHPGENRVRWNGRSGGRPVGPGKYRVLAVMAGAGGTARTVVVDVVYTR